MHWASGLNLPGDKNRRKLWRISISSLPCGRALTIMHDLQLRMAPLERLLHAIRRRGCGENSLTAPCMAPPALNAVMIATRGWASAGGTG